MPTCWWTGRPLSYAILSAVSMVSRSFPVLQDSHKFGDPWIIAGSFLPCRQEGTLIKVRLQDSTHWATERYFSRRADLHALPTLLVPTRAHLRPFHSARPFLLTGPGSTTATGRRPSVPAGTPRSVTARARHISLFPASWAMPSPAPARALLILSRCHPMLIPS